MDTIRNDTFLKHYWNSKADCYALLSVTPRLEILWLDKADFDRGNAQAIEEWKFHNQLARDTFRFCISTVYLDRYRAAAQVIEQVLSNTQIPFGDREVFDVKNLLGMEYILMDPEPDAGMPVIT